MNVMVKITNNKAPPIASNKIDRLNAGTSRLGTDVSEMIGVSTGSRLVDEGGIIMIVVVAVIGNAGGIDVIGGIITVLEVSLTLLSGSFDVVEETEGCVVEDKGMCSGKSKA